MCADSKRPFQSERLTKAVLLPVFLGRQAVVSGSFHGLPVSAMSEARFFGIQCPLTRFRHTICRKSPKLNTALALSGLTALLVSRLEHGDAVAKLTLLKIIKVSGITRVQYIPALSIVGRR